MKYCEEYWVDCDKVIEHIPNCDLLKKKRILITGATGMIGSAIAELLFRLNHTHNYCIDIVLGGRSKESIDNRFRNLAGLYKYIYFDAIQPQGDYSEIENVDYIIHAAGYGDPKSMSDYPVDIMMSNIIGTRSLLDLAAKSSARLLFVSSGEIYGKDSAIDGLYSEEAYGYIDVLNPRAVYPNAKRAAESLCISHSKQYETDVVIARSCHIYGPSIKDNDSRATASFTRDAFAKKDIVMKSAGAQRRSYCYTLDCASAMLTVLLKGTKGQAYNIANSKSVASIREVAEKLADISNVKLVFENPKDEEVRSYNMMENSILDASKLEQLGWSGCFDLQTGLKNTLKYYSP